MMIDVAARPRNALALSSNGVLLLVASGQQTHESIESLQKRLAEKIAELHRQNRKALILVDLSRVSGYNVDSKDVAQDLLLNLSFDAMAIFGASLELKAGGQKMVASIKQAFRIQFFDTTKAAAEWLAGDVIQQKSAIKALAHPIWPPRPEKRII